MAKKKVFSIGSSLSDGLEQTIAAAHNYSSDLRVDVIPLSKIETDPDNPRSLLISLDDITNGITNDDPFFEQKTQEIESLQSLSNSIKEQGIINPVIVYEHNGKYRLIAGERRTLASGLAQKTDIQAKILDGKPDEVKIRVLQWIENIERSDLSLAEKIDNLEKIIDAYARQNQISSREVTITDISQLVGCVKSHAMNLKKVLEADGDIKELIAKNQIRSLEKAAVISNIASVNLRKKALDECLNGATLKQLKSYLEKDKSTQKTPSLENIVVQKAGRPTLSVNFGKTPNVRVAGIILKSLITNPDIFNLEMEVDSLDFESPKCISDAFKTLVRKLELLHE
jgi:ParB family transcriptional regulator, chromosome partitioning protein